MIGLIIKSSQVVTGCAGKALGVLRGSVRSKKIYRPKPMVAIEGYGETEAGFELRGRLTPEAAELFREIMETQGSRRPSLQMKKHTNGDKR